MTFDEAKKDAALFALLKKFMVSKLLVEENYEFLMSTDGNQAKYTKFIPEGSPMQVNIDAPMRLALERLAAAGQWAAMDGPMKTARDEVLKITNMDTMPKFEKSDEYKNYLASKAPAKSAAPAKPAAAPAKPPAAPPKPPAPAAKPVAQPPKAEKPEAPKPDAAKAAPNLAALKPAIAAIEKDMTDGTKFLTTAKATVKSKGKPADKDEVGRMFESGRMRHDKVHTAFTALLQKDKAFTRENFGELFTKKDAYSKLWAEYRKLLGK